MTLTTPIVFTIGKSLQAALQAISVSGGYFNDLKATSVTIDAAALEMVPSTEVPWICVAAKVEPIGRDFNTSRPVAVKDRWRFILNARVDAPGGASTEARNAVMAQLEADIEKALTVDPERQDLNTLTSGVIAKALYTYVGQASRYAFVSGDQLMCFLELPVDVTVQRVYGQP